MQSRLRSLASTVLCLTMFGCGGDAFGFGNDRDRAVAVAESWVREHPAGWTVALRATDAVYRPFWTPSCTDAASNGYVSLRMADGPTEVELAFRCPLSPNATLEELSQQFRFAIPASLPTGLRSPRWSFRAALVDGAVYEDVQFSKDATGALRITVVARLAGIYARHAEQACDDEAADLEREIINARPLGDTECRIVRRHRVPVRLELSMPSNLAALR
ncbi:MAG: hypothetical protein IT357_04840 [Gemmatimonadaceae bacterium]|nr:hypothetical protein [Gemmatimonadaceae bacterium]